MARGMGLRSRIAALVGIALGTGLPGTAAHAQQAGDQQLQEIVVTAQKRASTVDKTPISITAVSGEELQDRGIVDFAALAAATPGISMKTNGPGQTEFEMRGMTSGGGNSPTVGFYLDDVPLTAPAGAQNGKVVIDPSLYDLARVEVLRGPQGTLYGAGSMGGTIKLVSNQPNLAAFDASAQAILSGTKGGGFNHGENAMINVPLATNQLAMRIVASQSNTSGWIDRIVESNLPLTTNGGNTRGSVLGGTVTEDHKQANAQSLRGGRILLTWKPTESLTIAPSVFYQRITQDGQSAFDSDPGTLAHYQPFSIAEPYADSVTVSNLTVNYRMEGFDITSVTSNWHRLSTQIQDGSENFQNPLDGFNGGSGAPCVSPSPFYGPCGTGPIFGYELDPSNQFSEELRAASTGDGPLQWVGGVFYSSFQSNWQLYTNFSNPQAFGSPIANVWTLDQPDQIRQKAIFGEATYAITEKLKLTGGLRFYSYNNTLDMSFSGWGSPLGTNVPTTTHQVQSNTGINPKLNVAYDVDRDLMIYGTVAKGFRPGGGNQPLPLSGCVLAGLNSLGYNGVEPMTYKADTLWSYEAGEKARLLGGSLRINASVFYENWQNIQLEELPCNYPLFDNANSAHIYGGEVEVRASLTRGLTIGANAGFTHATLAQTAHGFRAGDRLPDVAPFTASVNLSYHAPINDRLDLIARLENVYTGTRVDLTFPGGSPNTQTPLPVYDLTNVRVGLGADRWTASLFVNNLLNKKTSLENIVQLTLANAAFNRVATSQPLTAGVDLSYHF